MPNKWVKLAWLGLDARATYPKCYILKEKEKMKYLSFLILPLLLTSCVWIIVDKESQNPDGSHFVRLSGNAFATGKDMENKLKEYATKKCGKDNFEYTFSEKDKQEMHMAGGSFYSMSKPWLDANIQCIK